MRNKNKNKYSTAILIFLILFGACTIVNKKNSYTSSKVPLPIDTSRVIMDNVIKGIINAPKSLNKDSLNPGDYDPGFMKKLSLTKQYEKNIPCDLVVGNNTQATVETYKGIPTLYINGYPVYNMLMIPSPLTGDGNEEDIFKSCRDFAAAGINLYGDLISSLTYIAGSGWWLDEGNYDFSIVDRRFQAIIEANPNALIILRVKLDPPQWWMDRYPDEQSQYLKDGQKISFVGGVSLASDRWERSYEHMLRSLIRHIESSAYADHVIGYAPGGGRSSEWFWYGQALGDIDYSPAARERFRKWLKKKYRNDIALRAAWKRNNVTLKSVEFPCPETRRATECLSFRDPRLAVEYLDARQFLIDMVTHNVIKSCTIVKEETQGKKLAGVFYGYSLLRAGNSRIGRNQWGDLANNGKHDLKRILDSPVIDFFTTPIDYGKRNGGQPGNLIGGAYIASIHLHNKMFIDEEDIRTHLYQDRNIIYRTKTLDETISVLQRGTGWSLTKGNGLWWFLLGGNALFHQEAIMQTIASMKEIGDQSLNYDKTSASEVALFSDEVSLNYLADAHHPVVASSMWQTYTNVTHMGAPFDLYLLQDIAMENLPDYKVYVFLNTYYTTPALRKAINAKVRKNNAVSVWLYAPGFITDEGFSEDVMCELTGITIRHEVKKKKSVLELVNGNHPITIPVKTSPSFSANELDIEMGPRFWVEDNAVIILGECEGKPSLVVKEEKDWRSIYSAYPLTKELWQGICDYAGVHVYSRDYDVFFANHSYAMIHTVTSGMKTIFLPGIYNVTELITEKDFGRNISEINIYIPEKETRIFRFDTAP